MQDKLAVSMDSNKNSLEMLAEKRKELDKRYEDELKATQVINWNQGGIQGQLFPFVNLYNSI